MIFDTDILIWFFRNNVKAIDIVKNNRPFDISVVTSMEIMQGMRDKIELQRTLSMFAAFKVNILQINEAISQLAEQYVASYALSHSLQLADALIAATCVIHQKILLTGNDKHYRFIPGLNIMPFRPNE